MARTTACIAVLLAASGDEHRLRRRALAAMAPATRIVFAMRHGGRDHWYVNFGFYACPTLEYPPHQHGSANVPRAFRDGSEDGVIRRWGQVLISD